MSYVSLARKYRPRRFVDMVGQESTTLALTNAIRLHREPHSVIFTGVRGVGKTTSARIYAKALNCENGPTAEPCDVCASCVAITSGNHEDVLEIDGASNTGVDDVRALQETLSYVPQRSTFKIYIIDEVHMLSISAFNALLKTLEEPPQHVVFIFATTELHKVPETIQSRCQTFHLQKISRPVIADRVRSILTAEGIAFDEAALAIVAREGRGSMRDALTMLDQAIAVGGGEVSLEALKNMVGSSSQALPVLELLDGLLRKDASQILEVIGRWDQEGLAMSTLVEETAKACRNAFILRDLKGQAIDLQLLELEDREQQMLLEMGEKAAPMDLNRLFRQLAKCLDDLRHADLDRFILENYCLEWCFDPGLPDLQTLMNIISSGQPMPQVAARPSASQSAPAEGPAINLRERWKTSAPTAPTSPAARPVSVPQASAPSPAPLAKPAPQVKTTAPQASLEKPIAPTPGPVAVPQSVTTAQPLPQNPGMSSLVQKLAMAQAAQAAAATPAQPAVNPLRAAQQAHAAQTANPPTARPPVSQAVPTPTQAAANPVSRPHSETHSAAKPADVAQAVNPASAPHSQTHTAAKPAEGVQAVNSASAPHSQTHAAAKPAEGVPAVNSASRPAADKAPVSRPYDDVQLLNSAPSPVAKVQAPSTPKQPLATPATAKSPVSSRSGGIANSNGPALPPEPMPPFDLNDDDIPPWVLQDEVSRQGAVAAPLDEPMMPEPPKNEGFLKQMARRSASEAQTASSKADVSAAPVTSTAPFASTAPVASSAPVASTAPVVSATSDAASGATVWPENWRAFVDEWKKQKPLQGRVLEEAYILEYSQQRIRLAVEPSSMAGGKLLQQDVRKRLMDQFNQLFGFKGILEAVPKADANPGKTAAGGAAPDLGETLLDVKNREREVAREQLRHRLEEHPMTREVISRFGGTIEQIELQ